MLPAAHCGAGPPAGPWLPVTLVGMSLRSGIAGALRTTAADAPRLPAATSPSSNPPCRSVSRRCSPPRTPRCTAGGSSTTPASRSPMRARSPPVSAPFSRSAPNRFEGYSNPAWLALLVVGHWLGVFDHSAWFGVPDYVAFPKLLGLLCVAGVFACMYAIARAVTSRPVLVTLLAGAITAAIPSFVIWTTSGLENALLALAVTGIAAALARAAARGQLLEVRVAVVCGFLAALAALTRPDGIIYAAAFPLAALISLRRSHLAEAARAIVLSLASFVVPFGAYLLWRILTFGELLPNTAVAKSQGVPGVEALARPGQLVAYVGWLAVAVAVVLVGATLGQQSRLRPGLVQWLVPLALAVTAFVVLEPDWMDQYRFATPVWPLAAFAASAAGVHVLALLRPRGRAVVVVVAAVAALSSGVLLAGSAREFRAVPTVPLCVVAAGTGAAPNLYADRLGLTGGTVVAPDMGGAAMTSRLHLVDLVGLADARMAGFYARDDMPALRDYVLGELRPAMLRTHGMVVEVDRPGRRSAVGRGLGED